MSGTHLFLKVPNGVVIGVRKEVHALGGSLDVVLEVVHEMRSISLRIESVPTTRVCSITTYLDLLCPRDSTEDDLGKLSRVERAVRDASDDLKSSLDNRHTVMISIIDESSNVLSRHLGELLLEDVLEPREDDERGGGAVVGDYDETNNVGSFFRDGWSLASHLQKVEFSVMSPERVHVLELLDRRPR